MAWAAGLGFTIYSYSTAVQAKKRLYSADLESTDQKKKAQMHFAGIRPRDRSEGSACAGPAPRLFRCLRSTAAFVQAWSCGGPGGPALSGRSKARLARKKESSMEPVSTPPGNADMTASANEWIAQSFGMRICGKRISAAGIKLAMGAMLVVTVLAVAAATSAAGPGPQQDCPSGTFNVSSGSNACNMGSGFCNDGAAIAGCLGCEHCDGNDRQRNKCPECATTGTLLDPGQLSL